MALVDLLTFGWLLWLNVGKYTVRAMQQPWVMKLKFSHQRFLPYTFWSLEIRWPNMNPVSYIYLYIYAVICSLAHEWKLYASRKTESSFPNLWGEQKFNEQKLFNNLTTGEQTWNEEPTPCFYNEPCVKTWKRKLHKKKKHTHTHTHTPPPKVLFHTLTKSYSEIKHFLCHLNIGQFSPLKTNMTGWKISMFNRNYIF